MDHLVKIPVSCAQPQVCTQLQLLQRFVRHGLNKTSTNTMDVRAGQTARSQGALNGADDKVSSSPRSRDDRESSSMETVGSPPTLSDTRDEARRQARYQRPSPSPTECVPLGRTGIYSRAIHDDVQKLIRAYEEVSVAVPPTDIKMDHRISLRTDRGSDLNVLNRRTVPTFQPSRPFGRSKSSP